MRLYPVNAGYFKLDGGAMFGVVPKSIWNNLNPADDNNMCNWAMRCLLVEEGNRLILIDNGMGDKQDVRFFSHYYLNGNDTLLKSMNHWGFGFEDVTDVFLTHLHFDHCGGSIAYNQDRTGFVPAFKNATTGAMKNTGNGQPFQIPGKREVFLKKTYYRLRKVVTLNLLMMELK
jgi:glyoxylase-like metal-dependent hydrolase (beta-lactamase superfamily II)